MIVWMLYLCEISQEKSSGEESVANMTISQQSLQAYRAELLRQEKSQMTVQIYTKNCREFLYFVQAGLSKSFPKFLWTKTEPYS